MKHSCIAEDPLRITRPEPRSPAQRARLRAMAALACAWLTHGSVARAGTPASRAAPGSPERPAPGPAARWEPLAPTGWPALMRSLPRPAIVVFSASWCGNCPAIVTALAEHTRAASPRAQLVVVMIDGEPPAHHAGLPGADRLLRLRGDEAALRHAVNPRWRGLVPHVALLGADRGPPAFVDGMPSAEQLARWAGA